MSEQLVQEWMEKDPYLMDSEGFQQFIDNKMREAEEALRPKPKEAKPKSISYRPESQQWFKDLEDLADRRRGTQDLATRIYEEILKKGEQFTNEKADKFKEGTELLGKLLMIHQSYVEITEQVGQGMGGKWGDMFGDWLSFSFQLNAKAGQFLTPPSVAQFMAKLTLGGKEELERQVALVSDPAAGTGRFMLCIAEHYIKTIGYFNFVFVNIDIEFKVYVYCAMNAIINGIPSINIWGNSLGRVEDYNEAIVTIPIGNVAMWRMVKKEEIPGVLARANYLVNASKKESK